MYNGQVHTIVQAISAVSSYTLLSGVNYLTN